MADPLPEALEDAVLEILDGDPAARDDALKALLADHPQHRTAVHDWLVAAGLALGDWHGDEVGPEPFFTIGPRCRNS
jgi:hypothetical protein